MCRLGIQVSTSIIEAFFTPGEEIVLAHEPSQVLKWLRDSPESRRHALGAAARQRVLAEHTAAHRARTLERYIDCAAPQHLAAASHGSRTSRSWSLANPWGGVLWICSGAGRCSIA